jgi:hypothetical protein
MKSTSIAGVRIPDSKLAQAATELVRDTESANFVQNDSYFAKLQSTF